MSWRRCDAHAKRLVSSFSIDALIAKDNKDDYEQEQDDVKTIDNVEQHRTDKQQHATNVELDVDRLTATHLSSSKLRRLSSDKRDNDDDDDDDDDEDNERSRLKCTSDRQRADSVTTTVSEPQRHHQQLHHYDHRSYHPQQFHPHHPLMLSQSSVHPLMRQSVLTAANSSQLAASCTDALLRRRAAATDISPPLSSNSLFCGAPLVHGPATVAASCSRARDDELVPFYSWLLSRHGAFFNHRLHPAGICYFTLMMLIILALQCFPLYIAQS